MSILVSVIIPTFNSENTIIRCVNSVLNQTYKKFEIVICDDKSTDKTREILKSFNDQRISVYLLEKNSGSAVVRNTAMKRAKGDLIAFLDSDDEWYPEKLEKQIPYFLDKNVGIIFGGGKIIKNGRKIVFHKPKKSWEINSYRKLFLGEINYLTPTVIFRKECISKIGFMSKELRRNQDYDFYLRILKYYKLKIIEEPLAIIYMETTKHTSSALMMSVKFYEDERKKIFLKDFSQEEVNLYFARKYRDLSSSYLRSKEYSKSINSFRVSLKYSPTFTLKLSSINILFRSFISGLFK